MDYIGITELYDSLAKSTIGVDSEYYRSKSTFYNTLSYLNICYSKLIQESPLVAKREVDYLKCGLVSYNLEDYQVDAIISLTSYW